MKDRPAAPPARAHAGAPHCTACRHYFITHERGFPHGCRLLGIKSRRLPHLDVIEASEMPCQGFTPRHSPKTATPRTRRGVF